MKNNCQGLLLVAVTALLMLHQALALDYLDYDETEIVGKVQDIVEQKLEDDKVARTLIGVFPFSEDHKSHDHHDEEHHHDEHHHHEEHHGDHDHHDVRTSEDQITKAAGFLNQISTNGVADNSGKVCIDKVNLLMLFRFTHDISNHR